MYDSTKPYNKQIIELIKQTWNTHYVSVENGLVKKKFNYPEYHHSDGIGTKGTYHWKKKTLENAVIDAMAMNLNDMILERAIPYAIIDHLFIPEDNKEYILRTMKKLTKECKKRNIAITGGETAIHNTSNEIELSITMLGFIKNPRPNKFQIGDSLIGIQSSGLHSNGFTKVREVFDNEYRPEFTKPTLIYSDLLFKLNEEYEINGMMHITGGAYTKLRGLLNNSDVQITRHSLHPQPIFRELYEKGISNEEMYKIFNCGVGFILSISKKQAGTLISKINNVGFNADIIGKVIPGNKKIKIDSMFNNKEIEL